MMSIQLQYAPFPLPYFQPKHNRKQLQTPKLLPCPSSSEHKWLFGTSQRRHFHYLQGQTNAMNCSSSSSSSAHLVLGLTSPAAKSPDVSTLILISAILLVFYFVANFIVPDLIAKYFQVDKVDEDQKGRDENDF